MAEAPLLIEGPDEIFNSYLVERGYGRILPVVRNVAAPTTLELRRRIAEQILAQLPEPRPRFFFVQNEKLNAVAVERKGIYFIGVWDTFFYVLRDTFNRMLSLPNLFPNIGDPSREIDRGIRQPPPNNLKDLEYRDRDTWHIRPNDPVRADYAELLTDIAFQYVVFHEAAHVYNGHLGFLASLGLSHGSILEVGDLGGSMTSHLPWRARQMLEIDADAFATRGTFKQAIAMYREGKVLSEPWPTGVFSSGRETIETWATAVYTMFHVMFGTFPAPYKIEELTHPPAHVRLQWAMSTINRGSRLWSQGELDEDVIAVLGSLTLSMEKAYAFISGEPLNAQGVVDAIEFAKSNPFDLYADEWARMYPDLRRFARVPLVEPDPRAIERISRVSP